MNTRTRIEGISKYEVARKVVAMVFDSGFKWKPVSRIIPAEAYHHNGILKYICIMERELEHVQSK